MALKVPAVTSLPPLFTCNPSCGAPAAHVVAGGVGYLQSRAPTFNQRISQVRRPTGGAASWGGSASSLHPSEAPNPLSELWRVVQ